ncbi:MAG: hypothetical protein C0602_12805 [Denitrovibrio sp.]|nr:MAG: hypothetical protein C0602_12805 [Denitrovibrio sp.]
MISIGGIALPESAVWTNELAHGLPLNSLTNCTDGCGLVHFGEKEKEIDLYVPKIAGELTRQTALLLKALAEQNSEISININGRIKTAVFRTGGLELKPISAKQLHTDTDSYYGFIRLLEV